MINVTVTYASGNADSTRCASMGAALEMSQVYYDQLGCLQVIIKDEMTDRAWEYVGDRREFTMCPIGEEE